MVKPSDLSSNDDAINEFRKKYEIPSSVEFRLYSRYDTTMNNDGSWMEMPTNVISECGIRFPLPRLLRELLNVLDLHPAQLSPKSYKIISGVLKLNEMQGIDIGVWEILYCYTVHPERELKGIFYLKGRPKHSIIQCISWVENYGDTIFVRGDWEFPKEEVEPIQCRRTYGTLAEIPHWTKLKYKINLGALRSKVFDRELGNLAAGVHWRSFPVLVRYPRYDPYCYDNFTSLPAGFKLPKARQFFFSKTFDYLIRNQDGPGPALKDVDVEGPISSIGGFGDKVDDNRIEEEDTNVDSMENSENHTAPSTEGSTKEVDAKSIAEGTNVDSSENSENHTAASTEGSTKEVDAMSIAEGTDVDSSENSENHTAASTEGSTKVVDAKSVAEGTNVDSSKNSENHTASSTEGSTKEVDAKSIAEGTNVDSSENSENHCSQASSQELDIDDIPSIRAEGHETCTASGFDYNMDDIPSLIEGQVFPGISVSQPDLVPQRPYGLFKRKLSAHLSTESLCKKGKELHKEHGCSILNDMTCSSDIRAADKENIDSMSPDHVVNYYKVVAEKIGEGYISATKEVTRLNTLVENLERRSSTAENKLLAVESFSQGYQSEIRELQEKLKLLESRGKQEIEQARAEAIGQCHVKYSEEMAVIANQHYGHGWGGALMAAKVDGSSSLWNSDSIPWPYKGVEFRRPDIKMMLKSDAFSKILAGERDSFHNGLSGL